MFDANGMEALTGLFGVVALLVVCGIAFVVVRGVAQWRANEAAPLRSVEAIVVSRRTDVRARQERRESTNYFVTFEEPSGERRELQVSGPDFGQFAEGDRGHLMHRGTRYQGFTRQGVVDGPR